MPNSLAIIRTGVGILSDAPARKPAAMTLALAVALAAGFFSVPPAEARPAVHNNKPHSVLKMAFTGPPWSEQALAVHANGYGCARATVNCLILVSFCAVLSLANAGSLAL